MLTSDFLRGRRRRELSREEKDALEGAIGDTRTVPPRTTMVRRGQPLTESTLLLSGFACRYMDGRDGSRQLVSLHVPGDFVDLHGYPLQRLDHDVASITPITIAVFPHRALTPLVDNYPHLARMLWFSTLLDAALHREWIFRVGRLSAAGRIAHFLCETATRLAAVGRTRGDMFDLPMTQQDLGEACGLTSVHVNRTLMRLRADGLVTVAKQMVTIHDFAGLANLGEFAPDYLFLEDGDVTP